MKFYLIIAIDQKRGIGFENRLPWHLPADMKHFSQITKTSSTAGKQNAVIMGRKTWESLPEQFRPLPGRINIVLSQNPLYELPEGVTLALDLDVALEQSRDLDADRKFIIGGARIFEQAIHHPLCAGIYLTEVLQTFECDTFFPPIDPAQFERIEESEIMEENGIQFRFVEYRRKE